MSSGPRQCGLEAIGQGQKFVSPYPPLSITDTRNARSQSAIGFPIRIGAGNDRIPPAPLPLRAADFMHYVMLAHTNSNPTCRCSDRSATAETLSTSTSGAVPFRINRGRKLFASRRLPTHALLAVRIHRRARFATGFFAAARRGFFLLTADSARGGSSLLRETSTASRHRRSRPYRSRASARNK